MHALAVHPAFPYFVGLVHLALVSAWLLAARARWRTRADEARRVGVAALTALCGVAVVVAWVGPALPVGWMQPLREGFTEAAFDLLVGSGGHAGPLGRQFWHRVLFGGPATLRDLVTLSLAAGVVATTMQIVLFRQITGSAWATAALTLAVPLGPLMGIAALSETSGTLVAMYGLAGVLPFLVAADASASRTTRLAGATALASTTLLGALARPEVLALGFIALLSAAASGRPRVEGFVAGAVDRIGAVLRPMTATPIRAGMVLLLWVVVAERVLPSRTVDMRWLGRWTWALHALNPLNVRTLTLPLLLAGVLAPGVVAAAAVGARDALRRPLATAWLPFVLLWLYGTAYLAAHGGMHGQQRAVSTWEMIRYATILAPWVGLLAALGWRELASHLGTPGRSLVTLTFVLPPMTAVLPWLGGAHAAHPLGSPSWTLAPLQQSMQLERRTLLERAEAHPRCALVTFGYPWGDGMLDHPGRWTAVVPAGQPRMRHADLPDDAAWADVAAALALDGLPCGLAWQGIDCALDGASCRTLQTLGLITPLDVPYAPFVHPRHAAVRGDTLHLGFRSLPGLPETAPPPG